MQIAEIFYSIQGEGGLIGVPSVFVRTSGCNLRCTWCDTPYTSWQPEGETLPVERVVEQVMSYGATHVVITGGEPMIASEIGELTARLRFERMHITIETAGTVYAPVACDLMSISPKLANSTPSEDRAGAWSQRHEERRIQHTALRRLIAEYEHQLKFVVSAPEDLAEIQEILKWTGASPDRTILMPEGVEREELRARGLWLAEICKRGGFRFSPRLHVELWGNRRGT
ncbi:MAG: 7-carboxy-7-deazaguanine synthase QueE [Bryobacteraceae bacterium]